MPRILVSAFSCGPGLGSEPGVGWNTVTELARDGDNDLTVLVDRGAEPRIRDWLRRHSMANVRFEFIGSPRISRWLTGPLRHGVFWLAYYYLWQFAQRHVARRLHRERRFDVCHHVTYVKFNAPSFLAPPGVPFLWGPVGGAEWAPAVFYKEFGWSVRLGEALRVLLQRIAWFDPLVRWTAGRSDVALAATGETAAALRDLGARDVAVLPAVALTSEELDALETPPRGVQRGRLTLLFAGRLLAWKGVHLAIRALAASECPGVHLRIVGDGPARGWLEDLARREGVADRVEFTGALPREVVLRSYREADGFLFPSLHDSGGNVVLEAMAASLPVLCLDYGGPALFVDEACGWKIRATTPDIAVEGLVEAIREWLANPEGRLARGAAANRRVRSDFTSERRGQKLREILTRLNDAR